MPLRLRILPYAFIHSDRMRMSFAAPPTGDLIQPAAMERLPQARHVPGLTIHAGSVRKIEMNDFITSATNFPGMFSLFFSSALLRLN